MNVDRAPVVLVPLSLDDVDDILTWVNDQTIIGNIAAFGGSAFTRADEERYVHAMMASPDDRVFSIRDARDGRYLGQVGIHQIHWRSRVGRLAVVVAHKGDMGKGYGSAAIARALDAAFDVERLHKVWLLVFASNTRSRRTYARVGFRDEGLLREDYFHDGAWHDMARMAILDREWRDASA